MLSDFQLLDQHRTSESDDGPFAELVRRNVGWVHGAARRRLRDPHLADDVAQAVFFLLHRKSPHFSSDRALVAWLHRTTWYASEAAARQQRRRRHHETEAGMSRPERVVPQPDPHWEQLAPLLDQLIERLGRRDREAVLLRYYRQMTFAQVAAALECTEEAARKRVDRALDKLRQWARVKGAPLTITALAAGMETDVAALACNPPVGLIASATCTALAGSGSAIATSSLPIAKGAMTMMTLAKAKVAAIVCISSVIVTAGTAALVIAAQSDAPSHVWNAVTGETTPDTTVAKQDYPKLSPYDAIRWNDDLPRIRVDGTWYDWLALDGIETPKIVDFAKQNYRGAEVKMRIGEDLVEVMTKMGHAPGDTVSLKVRTLDTKEEKDLKDVPNTHENRQVVRAARESEDAKKKAEK